MLIKSSTSCDRSSLTSLKLCLARLQERWLNVNLGLKVHLSFNFSFGRACITPKVLSQYGTKLTGKIPEKKIPFA